MTCFERQVHRLVLDTKGGSHLRRGVSGRILLVRMQMWYKQGLCSCKLEAVSRRRLPTYKILSWRVEAVSSLPHRSKSKPSSVITM